MHAYHTKTGRNYNLPKGVCQGEGRGIFSFDYDPYLFGAHYVEVCQIDLLLGGGSEESSRSGNGAQPG
jgi:hypothetical protein